MTEIPTAPKRIHVIGFLVCDSLEEADRVSELVPAHVEASRAEPGCLKFDLLRSHEDPTRFGVAEVFRDREAFEAHQSRTHGSDWWAATHHIRREFSVSEE